MSEAYQLQTHDLAADDAAATRTTRCRDAMRTACERCARQIGCAYQTFDGAYGTAPPLAGRGG